LATIDSIVQLGPIRFESAWYALMHKPGNEDVRCGCLLDDESWVYGRLLTFNTDVEESADRELVLTAPILYRSKEADEPEPWRASAITISARRIKILQIDYLNPAGGRVKESVADISA